MVEEGVEHPTPSRPRRTSFWSSTSIISTFFFCRLVGTHNQLSYLSGLLPVKGGNGAFIGFLM